MFSHGDDALPRVHMTIASPMITKAELPTFTVFTATHNRAHTLSRVYDSLRAQTLRDFEWVIIDDGSSDNTAELVTIWAQQSDFPIRYFKQPHSGKHIAHNLALSRAQGQFFFPLDSDDGCLPNALEQLLHYWNSIPASERQSFCGVGGLSIDQYGELVGERFPIHPLDATMRERHYVHRVRGEKCLMVRTELGRRYLFPQIKQTNFVPEGMVWLEIGKHYKVRWINEVIRIYYQNERISGGTLSSRRNVGESAAGRRAYYIWLLNNDFEYFTRCPKPFLKAALMLPFVVWLSKGHLRLVIPQLKDVSAKALVWGMLPASATLYLRHLLRLRSSEFLSRVKRLWPAGARQ